MFLVRVLSVSLLCSSLLTCVNAGHHSLHRFVSCQRGKKNIKSEFLNIYPAALGKSTTFERSYYLPAVLLMFLHWTPPSLLTSTFTYHQTDSWWNKHTCEGNKMSSGPPSSAAPTSRQLFAAVHSVNVTWFPLQTQTELSCSLNYLFMSPSLHQAVVEVVLTSSKSSNTTAWKCIHTFKNLSTVLE